MVFAVLTTQVHSIRAASPWQDDPYDTAISFTKFFVPLVTLTAGLRLLVWRQASPQPAYRARQLLRAASVVTILIALTLVTDWLALTLRADHELWNQETPWLAASLIPLTCLAVASAGQQRRAARLLPLYNRRDPGGDWLDDLAPIVAVAAAHAPHRAGQWVNPAAAEHLVTAIRRHFVSIAAATSAAVALIVITGVDIGEGGLSPTLFMVELWIFLSGTFGFVLVASAALHVVALPQRGRVRSAGRAAAAAGALCVPVSMALRDLIWTGVGMEGNLSTPEQLFVLTLVCASIAAVLTLAVSLLTPRPRFES